MSDATMPTINLVAAPPRVPRRLLTGARVLFLLAIPVVITLLGATHAFAQGCSPG